MLVERIDSSAVRLACLLAALCFACDDDDGVGTPADTGGADGSVDAGAGSDGTVDPDRGIAADAASPDEDTGTPSEDLGAPDEDMGAPPDEDMGAPPDEDMGAPPDEDMGTPPDEDMGTPPDEDMGAPPEEDMGAPPEEDMGAPPEEDMGAPPEEDMGAPPEMDMGAPPEMDMGPPPRVDLGIPALACPADDGFEEDDDAASATDLAAGAQVQGILCGDDLDHFAVDVPAGCTLRASARFANVEGDINLRILDPDGQIVATAVSVTDDEELAYVAAAEGRHVVRLNLVANPENTYTLETEVVCPEVLACPGDDGLEENDGPQDATPLVVDVPAEGIVCGGDADYFALALEADCVLVAELDFVHAEGDLDLEVVDADDQTLASSAGVVDGETLVFEPPADDTFYLVVRGKDGADENLYTVVAQTRCGGDLLCPADDGFEPNDAADAPAELPEGGALDAVVCGADEDFYAVPVVPGCTIDARVDFGHADGDLDLYLLDPGGAQVSSSETLGDEERVAFEAEEQGVYVLRVALIDGEQNDYRLEVQLDCPPPQICEDDIFEENDALGDAADIPEDLAVQAVSCDADADWFVLEADAGCQVATTLLFTHAEGDLNIEIRDEAGGVIAEGNSRDDNERAAVRVGGAGEYFLRVVNADGAGRVQYSLIATVDCAPPCQDDPFEENDAVVEARPYPGAPLDGRSCPDDDDFFAVSVPSPGCVLTADLDFRHADADLNLRLLGPNGEAEATSASFTDDERIEVELLRAGPHALRVFQSGPQGTADYTLSIDVTCAEVLACPADDAAEENDAQGEATPLAEETRLIGIACDPDYYAVEADPGCVLDAELLFIDDAGDLDLAVFDPNGVPVGEAASDTDDERLQTALEAGGTYGLLVQGEPNSYVLSYNLACPDDLRCPDDDDFENNDAVAFATPAGPGVIEGIICGDDRDYFGVPLSPGCQLDVFMRFDIEFGELDLFLRNAQDQNLDSSRGFGDTEQVRATAVLDETIYIVVDPFDPDVTTPYTLDVEVTCPEGDPLINEVDYAPGGDEFIEIYNVGLAAQPLANLVVHAVDGANGQVYAEIPLAPAGEQLAPGGYLVVGTAGAREALPEGTLQIDLAPNTLQDAPDAVRLVRTREGGVDVLDAVSYGGAVAGTGEGNPAPAEAGGEALSRCENGADTDDNATDFRVSERTPGGANFCPQLLVCPDDDFFEDNDEAENASLFVADAPPFEGILCGADEDWFVFDGQPECTAVVEVSFSHADGDIDLRVESVEGVLLGESVSADDDERVAFPSPGFGPYRVRLTLEGEANRYSLAVRLEDCPAEEDP